MHLAPVIKSTVARIQSVVLWSALALSFGGCAVRIPGTRSCYRETVSASSLDGALTLTSPTLNASGTVTVAPPQYVMPQDLGVGFDIHEGASGVGHFAIRLLVGAGARHSRDVTLATLRVDSLPELGTYSMPTIGCVDSCPTSLPVIDGDRCAPESTICTPTDCDAGAVSPDAGVGVPLACLDIKGTLVVQANTIADCRGDNTHVEGQSSGQVCTTDFQAVLTFSTASGAAASLSGTLAVHYRQEPEEYECGSLND